MINIIVVFIYSFIQVIWIIMLLLREMPSRTPGPTHHSGHKSKVMSSHATGIFTPWKAILVLVVYIKQDFKNNGKYLHESGVFSEEFMLLTFL